MKREAIYKSHIEKTINCPQCGYPLPIYFKWTKLVQCPACKSSIFLEDESIKVIGKSSTLSPEPSLLAIGEPIIIENKGFLPLGKIRYLIYSGVGLQEVKSIEKEHRSVRSSSHSGSWRGGSSYSGGFDYGK